MTIHCHHRFRAHHTRELSPSPAPKTAKPLSHPFNRSANGPFHTSHLVPGDIVVSTVRPNLNAVAMVDQRYEGAIGSTGFCVLRSDPGQVEPRYLFPWVRTPMFVDDMVRQASGASYPAVTDRIVKASHVRLPPIQEQRRIAAVLDAAEEVRTKRRQALAKLDTLTQAIFIDMFGDPVTNPMGWWTDVNYRMLEQIRRSMRTLVPLIERKKWGVVTTDVGDVVGDSEAIDIVPVSSFTEFKKRAEGRLSEHLGDAVIAKVRSGEPLTVDDEAELQRLLVAGDVGDDANFAEVAERVGSLALFVRSLIGLDRAACEAGFAEFLDGKRYSSNRSDSCRCWLMSSPAKAWSTLRVCTSSYTWASPSRVRNSSSTPRKPTGSSTRSRSSNRERNRTSEPGSATSGPEARGA